MAQSRCRAFGSFRGNSGRTLVSFHERQLLSDELSCSAPDVRQQLTLSERLALASFSHVDVGSWWKRTCTLRIGARGTRCAVDAQQGDFDQIGDIEELEILSAVKLVLKEGCFAKHDPRERRPERRTH